MAFTDPGTDIVEEGDDLATFVANEDVIRGQVVKVAGENLGVQPADTGGEQALGVAVQTKSSGEQVAVALPGTEVKFTAAGSGISRMNPLTVDPTTNEGEVNNASTTGDWVIGVAYEGAGAQGDLVHGRIELAGQVN